jgi:microcystin-dependent protein
MATITGLTAARMIEIEDASVVDGEIVGGNLILTRHDGTTINAGPVVGPTGPTGPMGPVGFNAIPGEIKLWSGTTLPDLGSYGKWVFANGASYSSATYPEASANIHSSWKTFDGASDPGGGNFRVPDLRGLVPAGLDQMPGDGARKNRMTRSVAITIAGKTGEETHIITVDEMAGHRHDVNRIEDGGAEDPGATDWYRTWEAGTLNDNPGSAPDPSGYTDPYNIAITGGDDPHENVQPTVFIPYIVKLDD